MLIRYFIYYCYYCYHYYCYHYYNVLLFLSYIYVQLQLSMWFGYVLVLLTHDSDVDAFPHICLLYHSLHRRHELDGRIRVVSCALRFRMTLQHIKMDIREEVWWEHVRFIHALHTDTIEPCIIVHPQLDWWQRLRQLWRNQILSIISYEKNL